MRRFVIALLLAQTASSVLFSTTHAGKLVVSGGAYSFSAQSQASRASAAISGLGSYQLAYRQVMGPRVELDLGFSLIATETFGGDLAFGLDVGANYYPVSNAEPLFADIGTTTVVLSDRWRPFFGLGFHQRNFQSISSQYAGFGVKGGTEFQFDQALVFHGTLRVLSLGGPNNSSAMSVDVLGGMVFQF